jgi:hypothetical protein
LRGTRVKVLSKAYHAIATELKLTAKSEFREKLGTHEDPIYGMSLLFVFEELQLMSVNSVLPTSRSRPKRRTRHPQLL